MEIFILPIKETFASVIRFHHNKKTNVSISFEYNKETDVCVFKEVIKHKEKYTATTIEGYEKSQVKVNATQKKAYIKKFNALSDEEQKAILDSIDNEPFLKFIKDQEMQIYAYMTRHEK